MEVRKLLETESGRKAKNGILLITSETYRVELPETERLVKATLSPILMNIYVVKKLDLN